MPNERFEFYVSYCVMTKRVNRFGHGFMVISQLDHQQDEKARVEILDTVGLYSRYMPVLGFKPYTAHGRVKAEEHEYIVGQDGLFHVTFQISAQEMGEILTAINQDRRNIGEDTANPNTINPSQEGGEYKPGGPRFNLFKGQNCKRYALEKFEQIGIDTTHMHGFLEIPKLTAGMNSWRVNQGEREGKNIFYWDCPLVVSPRNANSTLRRCTISQFSILLQGVEKILQVLNSRKQTLRKQGHEVKEINEAIAHIEKIHDELLAVQSYPKRITLEKIKKWVTQVDNVIKKETTSLKQKNIETALVKTLLDVVNEIFYRVYHTIWARHGVTEVNANTKDKAAFKEIKIIQRRISL